MKKLNEITEEIVHTYEKNGKYPQIEGFEDIKGFYGSGDVMIISFCPNDGQDITYQLKAHYFYLRQAKLSDAHLTDFIKDRMTAEAANEYFKKPENDAKMKEYAEIIKWEIEKYSPKKIFLMGRNVEKLVNEHLSKFLKGKGIESKYIPHFTFLSYEPYIISYKKELELPLDTTYAP